jgi:nicotinamide-nucleotide amidase
LLVSYIGAGRVTTEIEIVCIGNELLIGKVVNTNASWIGKRCTSLGMKVNRITVISDDVVEITRFLQEALVRKPRFIILTGGLGPTFDDKTLEGIAKALGRELFVDLEALEMIKKKYDEYGKTRNEKVQYEMTASRLKMATLPEGAIPVFNPLGTAPGVRMEVENTVLIALPGVPQEMEAIFEESVIPLLRQISGEVSFYELSIYVDGIMESVLAPLIDTVMHDNPFVYIKSHPKGMESKPHMELHLSTSGMSIENPTDRLRKAGLEISGLIEKAGGEVFQVESAGNL